MVVIIPALNEADRVGTVIAAVRAALPATEIVVIDDGSVDETERRARAADATVVRHPIRLGYGAALRTGYRYADSRDAACIQIDADGQHDAAILPELVAALAAGADVAIGSRFTGPTPPALGLARRVGSASVRTLLRLLMGMRCSDPTSGLRALSPRMVALLQDDLPDDYPELEALIRASYRRLVVVEIPARHAPRSGGRSMHAGLGPLYYVYKLTLASVFASLRVRRASKS